MKAIKGNKVYSITENQKKFYEDSGFDILNDHGEIIAYGKGKTVPYAKYAEVLEALEAAKSGDCQTESKEVLEILKAYAQEHNIDLGKATTVSRVVKKIQEA